MTTRRTVALAASAFLAVLLLASLARPSELARRARLLAHDASRDPALRRLDGSSAAFDRRFFYFLESARRSLPPEALGVAILDPERRPAVRDLALYLFAPRPALLASDPIPPGWILAVYGSARPPGWREIARVSDGALLARSP
jgi:hypothetical protein